MSVDETQSYDVVVVGGGLAACCAAIQAARLGCRVVLLEKDPVLGGNAGPLLGVHPSGAHSFHPYASELGIIGEIIEEAAWQRAKLRTHGLHYNISQQFETVLKQTLNDAGVQVYRRTYGRDAEVDASGERRRITGVIAEDTARFKTVRFEVGTAVIDGSGDGHIAYRAGAEFRRGRESRADTGERSALEVADNVTLGTSVTGLARRCREPVEFIPPPGTPPFEPGYGRMVALGPHGKPVYGYSSWHPDAEFCFLWMTETGGQLDTIEDDHVIYEELLKQIYSGWASLKETQAEGANWELTWISPKAGKRESRRFMGDVIVSQTDVESGRYWPDAVCFAGYSVDIHNPSGQDLKQVDIVFYSIPPLWSMPYRALYSRNVANLFLAGRLCSVTHLGLGSWRLMRTLAAGGQAVGAAAALARRYDCDNRAIHDQHLAELQQTILAHDGAIPTVPHNDPADLAPRATVTASSETPHEVVAADGWLPLDRPRGVQLWHWSPRLESFDAYLLNESNQPVTVRLAVSQHVPAQPWREEHSRISFPYEPVGNRMEWGADNAVELFGPVAEATAELPPHFVGWVRFTTDCDLAPPDPTCDDPRVNLVLAAAADVSWAVSHRRHDFCRRLQLDEPERFTGAGDAHLFRQSPAPAYGEALNVLNGWNRRFSTNPLNAWQSHPDAALPQELVLTWPEPVTVGRVALTFDTLTRAYQQMPFDSGQRVSPGCVRDYRVDVAAPGGEWETVVTARDNYHRHGRHTFEPRIIDRLRLVTERVWDEALPARVYELRAYAD